MCSTLRMYIKGQKLNIFYLLQLGYNVIYKFFPNSKVNFFKINAIDSPRHR